MDAAIILEKAELAARLAKSHIEAEAAKMNFRPDRCPKCPTCGERINQLKLACMLRNVTEGRESNAHVVRQDSGCVYVDAVVRVCVHVHVCMHACAPRIIGIPFY